MRLDIREMMDGCDDGGVEIAGAPSPSPERIRELTMSKINGTRGKRRVWKTSTILIAAVIAALLLTGAGVAVSRMINARYVAPDEVIGQRLMLLTPEGDMKPMGRVEYPDADMVLSFTPTADEYYLPCFSPGWLPEMAEEPTVWSLGAHLEYLANQTGEDYEALLARSGMSREDVDDYCTSLYYPLYGGEDFFRIDLFGGAGLATTKYILNGKVTVVEETTINGLEALLLTVDYSGSAGMFSNTPNQNHVVLCGEGAAWMVNITGNEAVSMDTLVKIAENLDVKLTGIMEEKNEAALEYSIFEGGLG